MRKRSVRALAVTLLVLPICAGLVSCSRSPRTPGKDASSAPVLEPGKGRVAGVVADKVDLLPDDVEPQTYEGASIAIYRAVEAGAYRVSAEEPVRVNYEVGETAAVVESGENGCWHADLDPGKYFVRAFYGDSSYSETLLVDVKEAAILELQLGLIHGV